MTTTEQQETARSTGYDDSPAMVHIGWATDPTTALCGKRIMGIRARKRCDCIVCAEIDAELTANGL